MSRTKLPLTPRSLDSIRQHSPDARQVTEMPCPVHDAARDEPCYRYASGVCRERIRAWLGRSTPGGATRPAEPLRGPEAVDAPPPSIRSALPLPRTQDLPQIIPEDVRSSVPVDMDRLSPLERRAAEIRAVRREQERAEAVRRERLAHARRHWAYLQQTTPTPTDQKGT